MRAAKNFEANFNKMEGFMQNYIGKIDQKILKLEESYAKKTEQEGNKVENIGKNQEQIKKTSEQLAESLGSAKNCPYTIDEQVERASCEITGRKFVDQEEGIIEKRKRLPIRDRLDQQELNFFDISKRVVRLEAIFWNYEVHDNYYKNQPIKDCSLIQSL